MLKNLPSVRQLAIVSEKPKPPKRVRFLSRQLGRRVSRRFLVARSSHEYTAAITRGHSFFCLGWRSDFLCLHKGLENLVAAARRRTRGADVRWRLFGSRNPDR